MAVGGLVELVFGAAAERKSLEARPLTVVRQAGESLTCGNALGGVTPAG